MTEQCIKIRANSKGNGITSSIMGGSALLLGFILLTSLPKSLVLIAIGIISLGIIASVIGFYKIKEPEHSIILDQAGISYHHRHGQWHISWNNIQRIDQPRITRGIEQIDLHLVGIKLKTYPSFLDTISRRLMTNTLIEQRPLLMQNPDTECSSGMCGADDLIEKDRFKLPDGSFVTGVQGMFANRMNKLRSRLGFDVFINEAELDRPVHEFVQLLRACQADIASKN
jgi:hypothetical protein